MSYVKCEATQLAGVLVASPTTQNRSRGSHRQLARILVRSALRRISHLYLEEKEKSSFLSFLSSITSERETSDGVKCNSVRNPHFRNPSASVDRWFLHPQGWRSSQVVSASESQVKSRFHQVEPLRGDTKEILLAECLLASFYFSAKTRNLGK